MPRLTLARRAGSAAIDWIKVSAAMPTELKGDFNSFRSRHDTIKNKLNGLPEQATPVDFEYYKANVKNAALVEAFMEKYNAVKVPYPADNFSSGLAADVASVEESVTAELGSLAAKRAALNDQLVALANEKPFEEMTSEEYLEARPELKAQVEKQIANDPFWH